VSYHTEISDSSCSSTSSWPSNLGPMMGMMAVEISRWTSSIEREESICRIQRQR
jgi:hypothetical protein